MNDERKILEMLAAGQINVEEATELLDAIKKTAPKAPRPPEPPQAPKGTARTVRVRVESKKGNPKADVDVVVPIGLARLANKFVPVDVREKLEQQGIDLTELLEGSNGDLPKGRLLNIETSQEDGAFPANIRIDVN